MIETNWKNTTTNISNINITIAFLTNRQFYFGSDKNRKQLEKWEDFSEALYLPFQNPDLLITTENIKDNKEELIKYYENVVALSKKHGKKISPSYFWIRPLLRDKEDNKILTGFPWYDTMNEVKYLFSELQKEEEGTVFYDVDQGWELVIENKDGKIYLQESDPDYNEIHCSINFDRNSMIQQSVFVLHETQKIINKLVKHFGFDCWTKRSS